MIVAPYENHVGSFLPGVGWFAPPKSIRVWEPTLLWNHFAVLSVKRSLRGFERKGDLSTVEARRRSVAAFPMR